MMRKTAIAATAWAVLAMPASAAVYDFTGADALTPDAGTFFSCTSGGADNCQTAGSSMDFTVDGVLLQITGHSYGYSAGVIEDIVGDNGGMGVTSEPDAFNPFGFDKSEEETNSATGESLLFSFDRQVSITTLEMNSGDHKNCQAVMTCGTFDLLIDNIFVGNYTAMDYNGLGGWIGTSFEFVAKSGVMPYVYDDNYEYQNTGFYVGGITAAVPEPGTWLMMILGFALTGIALKRQRRHTAQNTAQMSLS